MARKRMVDPNIWQSEDFSKLSVLAKLVFIGLFSLADDEGRGRANPTYLKSSLFPYNEDMKSTDIQKTLIEISSNMSIVFYEYNGSSYYSLLSWSLFQKIDRPTSSQLPAFDESNKDIRRLFVEPSSKGSREVVPNRIEDNRIEKENKINRIKDKYNLLCTNLPKIKILTDKRKNTITTFLKKFTEEQFEEICNIANNSNFLIGKNDSGWKADFDFLMRIDKATSILEGKYSNNKPDKLDGFKDLWKEAQDEENGNGANNNTFGW